MATRLRYSAPKLESLGSLVELTKTGPASAGVFDGTGYTAGPPGS